MSGEGERSSGGAARTRRSDGRAQTPFDFALGISVFIVTIAFVFAFVPSTLTFASADPGAKEAKQADRAATTLIGNLSTGHRQNQLNGTATADYFNTTSNESALQADLALPSSAEINVTVRSLDGTGVARVRDSYGNDIRLAAGRSIPEDQPAAEIARIVAVTNDDNDCDPACQFIVRVW